MTFVMRIEPYEIPLEDPQEPVFVHTGGKFLSFLAGSDNREVVIERLAGSRVNLLQLYTVGVGMAVVGAVATDNCEFSAGISVVVRVVE